MEKKMTLIPTTTLFIFSLLFGPSFGAVQDFCIADYESPQSPTGFACKDRSKVTAQDFVFSGLAARTNTSTLFKSGIATAFYNTFPGVNGLGLALARADIEPGGVVPLHTHPRGSEILIVIEGTLISGLIAADENKVYLTTLKQGDVMVYPHGLLHFQVNKATSPPATFFVGFNSDNPGLQFTAASLFGNDFPTELVNANTFINPEEIKRLKALFSGSG